MTLAGYRVIALHGNLGSPADWEPFARTLPDARLDAVNVWDLFSSARVCDWASIGTALGERVRASVAEDDVPAFVLGYSLGARLLLSVPGLGGPASPVAGTCLVSCHPGLPDEDDGARALRRDADEKWAQRFIDAPVGRIWKEWDAQPVFAGSAVPRREDSLPAPRVTLARAMRVASLASQPDRRPLLGNWERPLLWVTGERDAKFRAIAGELETRGVLAATFFTCQHAGHRVPWDNPALFTRTLREWIENVLATR